MHQVQPPLNVIDSTLGGEYYAVKQLQEGTRIVE
jgi:hypothetical protein